MRDVDGYLDPERGRTSEGDLDPHKIAAELEQAGTAYAEARAEAKLLEKQESVILAQLVIQFQDERPGLSRIKATDQAKASDEYSIHIEAMVEAGRKANTKLSIWKAAQARFEAMRTAEATRRAEMQTFRGSR